MTCRAIVVLDECDAEISACVTAHGYELTVGFNGSDRLQLRAEHPTDVIVLDQENPGKPSVRATVTYPLKGHVPAVRLSGFAEPADVPEVTDLLDRVPDGWSSEQANEQRGGPAAVYRRGDLVIDFEARRVTCRACEVELTLREYEVLAYLARNAGKIRTLREIFESVWGRPYVSEATYLWTYVRRLRQKLELDPRQPMYVLSRSSLGYFVPAPDTEPVISPRGD
jgi:DNA-binding response OmpR family regulator